MCGVSQDRDNQPCCCFKAIRLSGNGPIGINDPDIENNILPMTYNMVEKYDAFQDNPWPIIYKELDAKFPDSKFILTVREPELWLKSQVRHFGRNETPMRKWIYGVGCPENNENIYLRRFENHNNDVLCYFNNRPQDLLVMDLAKGDGWKKLCSFLGTDIPNIQFPHANKARDRDRDRDRDRKYLSNISKRLKAFVKSITTRRFF